MLKRLKKLTYAQKLFATFIALFTLASLIFVIAWYVNDGSDGQLVSTGKIVNKKRAVTDDKQGNARGGSENSSGGDSKQPGSGTAKGIIANADSIAAELGLMLTDGWSEPSNTEHEANLKKLGVVIDWDSMKQSDGKHVFKYGDETDIAYAGWLSQPFTCKPSADNSKLSCEGVGDYGHMNKLRNEVSADYADQIHHLMVTQVHGREGSERALLTFKFSVKISDNGEKGTLVCDDLSVFTM